MNEEKLTYSIRGAMFEVYNTLGGGFLESVYQEALGIELERKGIRFEKEKHIYIQYKNKVLNKYFIADYLCEDEVLIEIKAVSELLKEHEAQILNYLKATDLRLGILVNFGPRKIDIRRYIV